MTFSEIVHLLSNHKVPKSQDQQAVLVPLLEKFANMGGIENDVNDAFNAVMGSSQDLIRQDEEDIDQEEHEEEET